VSAVTVVAAAAGAFGATAASASSAKPAHHGGGPSVSSAPFGSTIEPYTGKNTPVERYTLSGGGVTANVLTFGAIIQSIDGPAVGRRDHRPARHPARAGAGPVGRGQRAAGRRPLRRLPDVRPR